MIRSRGFCRLSPVPGLTGFVLSVVGLIRRARLPRRFLNMKRTIAAPASPAMMIERVGRPPAAGIEGAQGTNDEWLGREGMPGGQIRRSDTARWSRDRLEPLGLGG